MSPDDSAPPTPRWRYRLDNYHRALELLRQGVAIMAERELTPLEKEGLIQRFEYSWELAWKVVSDYLQSQGVILDTVTPRAVLRAAIEARLLDRGEVWMEALDARNRMSHTYSLKQFERVIEAIVDRYLAILESLQATMAARAADRA